MSLRPRRGRRAVTTILSATVLTGVPRPVVGQSSMPDPGQVAARIVAAVDTTQAYALYLPSTYSDTRRWPVLFVMDPRGRALPALELFRDAAEELGWVVVSSYNTRSDEPVDLNTPAFNAMLDDAQARLPVDPRRLYLAGFSGTASAAWSFAPQMSPYVAGIVLAGYGLPAEIAFQMRYMDADFPFAVYATAGLTDFNFELVLEMDQAMDAAGMANRVLLFEGGHAWMPPELAADALRWMELRAMRSGLRPVDADFVAARKADLLDRATALERGGRPLEAVALLSDGVRDFEDDRELAQWRDSLATTDAHASAVALRAEHAREAADYAELLQRTFGEGALDEEIDPAELGRTLRAAPLLERARGDDALDALQARRLLAAAVTRLSFYAPRGALEQGRPGHALAFVAAAETIQPENPSICRFRAFAHAQLGAVDEAIEALRCWTGRVKVAADALATEPYLAPLRDEPRFRALLRDLGGG